VSVFNESARSQSISIPSPLAFSVTRRSISSTGRPNRFRRYSRTGTASSGAPGSSW